MLAERGMRAVAIDLPGHGLSDKPGDPTLYTSGDASRADAIKARLDEARALVAKLTARWEELEAKRDASV